MAVSSNSRRPLHFCCIFPKADLERSGFNEHRTQSLGDRSWEMGQLEEASRKTGRRVRSGFEEPTLAVWLTTEAFGVPRSARATAA